MSKTNAKKTIITYVSLMFLLFLFNSTSLAMTYFYVDPDYTGNSEGTSSNPWNRCDLQTQWDVINSSLSTDSVTVYFSAKEASTNENETSNYSLKILREDTTTNLLILDGISKYNSNDTTPNWLDSNGNNKHYIVSSNPITTTTQAVKRSYITIKGFSLKSSGYQGIYYWGGDFVTIENNDVDQSDAKAGPGVYFQYARKVGDWEEPCVPDIDHNCGCTDITIKDNTIHDTYGECLYIGGINERESTSESVDVLHRMDYLGHTNITISGNTISDCGISGGQGDGIDIKPGNENIIVSGNTIYMSNQGEGVDGIIIDAGALVENNYIYNFGKTGINMSAFWNTRSTRDNSIIRNNVIVNTGGDPNRSIDYGIYVQGAGIDSGYDEFTNIKIYNNTITGVKGDSSGDGDGIYIANEAENASLCNNIISETQGAPLYTTS